MCAAELIVLSSFAQLVFVHSMVPKSVEASLEVDARRTSCFQEVLKASETLGDCEQK